MFGNGEGNPKFLGKSNDFVGLPNAHACLNARSLRVHAEWKGPTGSVTGAVDE